MAVKIRLTRKGKKHQPTYRVVVADARSPRDGRFIEQIGRYDPRQQPSIVEIDNERATYWLANGAQPSDQVRKLLEISGALTARPVKERKVHVVDEKAQMEAEKVAVAEAAAAAQADAAMDTTIELTEEASPESEATADESPAAADESPAAAEMTDTLDAPASEAAADEPAVAEALAEDEEKA